MDDVESERSILIRKNTNSNHPTKIIPLHVLQMVHRSTATQQCAASADCRGDRHRIGEIVHRRGRGLGRIEDAKLEVVVAPGTPVKYPLTGIQSSGDRVGRRWTNKPLHERVSKARTSPDAREDMVVRGVELIVPYHNLVHECGCVAEPALGYYEV